VKCKLPAVILKIEFSTLEIPNTLVHVRRRRRRRRRRRTTTIILLLLLIIIIENTLLIITLTGLP
jgi:hypothetical protein